MTDTDITFREVWSTRRFHSLPTDKKAKLKAASSLMNTMRYYGVVGLGGRGLKDVFAETKVVPLLPDPNCPEQWPDQHLVEPVRRVLCDNTNGQYRYGLTALAAIAAATVFSDNRKEFEFVCGLYKGAYPSEIRDILGHIWKHRVAVKGDDTSDKPKPTEFKRILRWMYHHLRPHHEELMHFFDDQILQPET